MAAQRSEDFYIKNLFSETKLKEVMNEDVVRIYDDDQLSLAQIKFLNNKISHLMVVDRQNTLVGLISQKYIYKAQSPRKIVGNQFQVDAGMILDGDSYYFKESLNDYILSDIVKFNPYSLTPDDSLANAVKDMKNMNLGCIPVVDKQKKLVGSITHGEIMKFVAETLEV